MSDWRYLLRTFGCQMNKRDSDRIAGLLTADGYVPTGEAASA
jgi:tRNA-2-methylthio-N6-dimethylallyladenosine synthase